MTNREKSKHEIINKVMTNNHVSFLEMERIFKNNNYKFGGELGRLVQ